REPHARCPRHVYLMSHDLAAGAARYPRAALEPGLLLLGEPDRDCLTHRPKMYTGRAAPASERGSYVRTAMPRPGPGNAKLPCWRGFRTASGSVRLLEVLPRP